MSPKYLMPRANSLSGRLCHKAVLQYSLDFSQCPSGDPDNNNQILNIIDSGEMQIELCASEVYSEGFLLTEFQCAETGSTIYSSVISSLSSGRSLSCASDSDIVLILLVQPSLPLNCTITSDVLFSQSNGPVQLCE